jgi:mRNA degradation ribonuclease J1/J2
MNLNLYRCAGKWLAVDCGMGFGGAENPEVEIMVPDPTFIAERRDRLVGQRASAGVDPAAERPALHARQRL